MPLITLMHDGKVTVLSVSSLYMQPCVSYLQDNRVASEDAVEPLLATLKEDYGAEPIPHYRVDVIKDAAGHTCCGGGCCGGDG